MVYNTMDECPSLGTKAGWKRKKTANLGLIMVDSGQIAGQDASQKREPEINKFFRVAIKTRASDLHLKAGQPARLRIQDELRSTTGETK